MALRTCRTTATWIRYRSFNPPCGSMALRTVAKCEDAKSAREFQSALRINGPSNLIGFAEREFFLQFQSALRINGPSNPGWARGRWGGAPFQSALRINGPSNYRHVHQQPQWSYCFNPPCGSMALRTPVMGLRSRTTHKFQSALRINGPSNCSCRCLAARGKP